MEPVLFSPVYLNLPQTDVTLVELDASTRNLVTVPVYPEKMVSEV